MFAKDKYPYTKTKKRTHIRDERYLKIKNLIWSGLDLVLKNLGSVLRRKSMIQNMRFDDSSLKRQG
jgi:hypothetical protein